MLYPNQLVPIFLKRAEDYKERILSLEKQVSYVGYGLRATIERLEKELQTLESAIFWLNKLEYAYIHPEDIKKNIDEFLH